MAKSKRNRRPRPASTPVRATTAPPPPARSSLPFDGLLPLRAFLGVTFVFAGLQKLADRNFLRAGAPGSIQSQLSSAIHSSPVPWLASASAHAPVAVGLAVAFGELAVGLGVLLGLWTRVAAAGGMVLSLSFFLLVSFHTWPYYYGSDIAFLLAWSPFVLTGGGQVSLDAWVERRVPAAESRVPSAAGSRSRRVLLQKAGVAGIVAGAGAAVAGLTAAIGHSGRAASGPTTIAPGGSGSTSTPATTGSGSGPTTVAQPAGTAIGASTDVPLGGAAQFNDPATQSLAYVLQPTAGKFVAFSAICTHAGCTVDFSAGDRRFTCPCHGSVFNALTGAVVQGPAFDPLPSIPVVEGADGKLYADG